MKTMRVIGGVYVLSALWCMFKLDMSAEALGFGFASPYAQLEYFSVYGGLQLGLGIAMLAASFQPKFVLGSVFFAFVFSSILAAIRLLAITLFPANDMMWGLLVLESVIAVSLWRAWHQLNLAT
ncbi:MAG: hypothetical protein ACJA1U_000885 [Bermanella sp.]|jgi:hypothetical protein